MAVSVRGIRGIRGSTAEDAENAETNVTTAPRFFLFFSFLLFPVELNELTATIIGCAIQVHRRLGPGLLESAYRVCLAYELNKRGLHVEQEKPIAVIYDEVKLECGFRADLLVAGQVIVECKAKDTLHPVDQAQITSHLRLLDLRVGLLINFHEVVLKDGIRRIVNNYQED